MQINAELTTIRADAVADTLHPVGPANYGALCAHYESVDAEWPYEPVLIVEDCGNGVTYLDGHHRRALARDYGVSEIPAYQVSRDDFNDMLAEDFDGTMPARLEDLDAHILVNGRPYQR